MSQDFERLVKDSFEHFEADVSPKVWTNIQAGLHAAPVQPASGTGSSAVSSAAKTAGILGKFTTAIITISAATVITAIGTWYYIHQHQQKVAPAINTPATSMVSIQENSSADSKMSSQATAQQEIKSSSLSSEKPTQPHTLEAHPTTQRSGVPTHPVSNEDGTGKQVSESVSAPKTVPSDLNNENSNSADDANTHVSNPVPVKAESHIADQETVHELIESYQNMPLAYIIANPVIGNAPLTVHFSNNGYVKSSSWEIAGELLNDSRNEISYTFNSPGKYIVRLTAFDQKGKAFTDQVQIEVKGSQSTLASAVAEIQNVFTPNGDGFNDVFKVKGTNLISLKGIIFNTSGQTVYQWNDPEQGWDGRINNGGLADEGAYYYIIEATGIDGKVYRFKGAVRLIK